MDIFKNLKNTGNSITSSIYNRIRNTQQSNRSNRFNNYQNKIIIGYRYNFDHLESDILYNELDYKGIWWVGDGGIVKYPIMITQIVNIKQLELYKQYFHFIPDDLELLAQHLHYLKNKEQNKSE